MFLEQSLVGQNWPGNIGPGNICPDNICSVYTPEKLFVKKFEQKFSEGLFGTPFGFDKLTK